MATCLMSRGTLSATISAENLQAVGASLAVDRHHVLRARGKHVYNDTLHHILTCLTTQQPAGLQHSWPLRLRRNSSSPWLALHTAKDYSTTSPSVANVVCTVVVQPCR